MLLNYGDHYRYEPPKLTPKQLATLKALPVEDLAYSNLLAYNALMVPGYKVAPHNVLIAEHLMAVEKGDITRLAIFVPPRHGKRLADNTMVLTPLGWKKHGDLYPGDYVFGPDGNPTQVVFRSDKDMCDLDVEFTNGEIITTHREHLWSVCDRRSYPQLLKTLETQELAKDVWIGEKGVRGGRARWLLPDIQAIEYPFQELPMHPYVLGAWLGDGSSTAPLICHDANDLEIIKKIESLGYIITNHSTHKETGVMYAYFGNGFGSFDNNLRSQLKSLNVFNNKHIPEIYLRSSLEQRLELLAGLIDTDGHVEAKTGRVRFSTCSEQLRDGVFDLAAGLGFRPYISSCDPCVSSSGIVGKQIVYQVGFQPNIDIPTQIPRKKIKRFAKRRRVAIKDIRPAKNPEMGHCIKVDRKDGLYLVGKQLVVTHNTMLASELFPSWYLGRNPEKQIIATTYSHDRASDVGRNVRGYMIDPLWKEIFPQAKISADSKSANKIGLIQGGNYFSVGVGGAIVGRGAHCFLIDDPIKSRLDAESKIVQKKLRNWYRSVAFTRLMPGNSAIVVILTRWSFWDLPGWLLQEHKHENWVVLELPAVATEDNDPIGRRQGDALWPSEYPIKRLEAIKRSVGTREWNSQYQQKPLPEEGGMLQLNWFKTYNPKDLFFLRANTKKYANSVGLEHTKQKLLERGKKLFHRKADYPRHFVKVICSWDTAFKPHELSDPSACTVWGITNDNLYYLIWVINERLEFPDLVAKAKVSHELGYIKNCLPFGAVSLLIEDKASGQSLIQELRRSTKIPVIPYVPKGDKTIRFSTVTNVIESGRIFVPTQAPWLVDYQTQLIQFPLGRNDDMVDSTSQFLDYIQKPKLKRANKNIYWK